jgi:transcriptional regulator with XRE-family HTH domain
MNDQETHEIEQHVGRRIRERRTSLGLTQQQLANMIGVTYQQAHKYERGINRISAGRLYEIAGALGVDTDYFYAGLVSSEPEPASPRQRMSLELVRNFARIRDERCRESLAQLCRAMADDPARDAGEATRTDSDKAEGASHSAAQRSSARAD